MRYFICSKYIHFKCTLSLLRHLIPLLSFLGSCSPCSSLAISRRILLSKTVTGISGFLSKYTSTVDYCSPSLSSGNYFHSAPSLIPPLAVILLFSSTPSAFSYPSICSLSSATLKILQLNAEGLTAAGVNRLYFVLLFSFDFVFSRYQFQFFLLFHISWIRRSKI